MRGRAVLLRSPNPRHVVSASNNVKIPLELTNNPTKSPAVRPSHQDNSLINYCFTADISDWVQDDIITQQQQQQPRDANRALHLLVQIECLRGNNSYNNCPYAAVTDPFIVFDTDNTKLGQRCSNRLLQGART